MLIINLMIIALLIYSLILLSGVKIMLNSKYASVIVFLLVTYTPLSELIKGYKLGDTSISSIIIFCIVFLLIFIWGYRRNKHIYSIHNVKQKDVINIIKRYFKIKNIKYEAKYDEIYLPEAYESIFVDGSIEIRLDFRNIKNMDFYNELVENIRVGVLYWITNYFLVNFLN